MLGLAAAVFLPLAAANSWLQPADSPVAALFKRADGSVPDPNAADWATHYPAAYATPNATTLPKAWLDKLKTVTLPPNNPVSTLKGCCNVKYNFENGSTSDGMPADICSFTAGCHTDNDLFLAPDGVFVLTFDDGPSEASPELYNFLSSQNVTKAATHFMIGGNIMMDPKGMKAAFDNGGHIAVHTWSHKYTTSLSNEGVLAELGWTMQVIHDLTGGRLPAFWRPPYGDTDNRVRAIAEQVFGMRCVLWNRDTNDWAIGSNPEFTIESVQNTMSGWFTGPKSPGILALEHELNMNSVEVFKNQFWNVAKNGWIMKSVADAFNMHWYQNAHDNTGPVSAKMEVGVDTNFKIHNNESLPGATPSASANASTASNGSTSAVGGNGTANGTGNGTAKEPGTAQNNKKEGSSAGVMVIPGAAAFLTALVALVL